MKHLMHIIFEMKLWRLHALFFIKKSEKGLILKFVIDDFFSIHNKMNDGLIWWHFKVHTYKDTNNKACSLREFNIYRKIHESFKSEKVYSCHSVYALKCSSGISLCDASNTGGTQNTTVMLPKHLLNFALTEMSITWGLLGSWLNGIYQNYVLH